MEIAWKTYLFVAALMVFLVVGLPNEVEAQGGGLTCGWCEELGPIHGFPNGGDKCGWPNPGQDYQCSRCGGTSHCHGFISWHAWGPCHMACGGTTAQQSLSDAVSDLRSGLDVMDLERVAETIASTRDGFSIEYLPEAGRIDLVLACAPSIPAGTVPVPPGIRPSLERALKQPVPVVALVGRSRDAGRKQALEE